jgi:hypothetical protein
VPEAEKMWNESAAYVAEATCYEDL